MTQEAADLQKEIRKTKRRLNSLERRLAQVKQKKVKKTQKDRYEDLLRQVQKKCPGVRIDRELLSVVGILPRTPKSKDKQLSSEAIAEKYGS